MKRRMFALLLTFVMLLSAFPVGAFALNQEMIARDKTSARDNVQMSKEVREHLTAGSFDGTYDIILEAYANGYYQPVDVVLVVDQSGSMSGNYGNNNKSNLANLKEGLMKFATSLKDVDKENRLAIIGFADDYSDDFDNTELFIGSQTVTYGDKTNNAVYDLDEYQFYTTDSGQIVMYNSQNNQWGYYTSGCGTSSEWNQVTPKTSASSNGTQFYEAAPVTSQYQSAFKSVSTGTGSVNSEITSSINSLAGEGATYSNFGMQMAYEALLSRPASEQSRNSIVVFFTDGYPGDGPGYEDTDAAAMCQVYADTIKQTFGSSIYTVCLKGDDYSYAKSFCATLSSGSSYSTNVDDSASLPDIFGMIYSDFVGINANMTANAKLVDTLSDKFELVGSVDEAIKITQMPYTNRDQWGAEEAVSSSVKGSYNSSTNEVTITGFNFADIDNNVVYYDSQGIYHGNKLHVVIHVRPKEGNNTCWDGVAYGALELVPTELVKLVDGTGTTIAQMRSQDSDYFNAFKVPVHHIMLSVEDQTTPVGSGTITAGSTVNITPNNAGYSVTSSYTAASGSTAGTYTGSFNEASTNVKYNNTDVTKYSVIRYVPGKLNIVSGDVYVVTVKGNSLEVEYDGQAKTIAGYTFEVKKNGVVQSGWSEGAQFTLTGTKTVTKTNAGTYAMGLAFAKSSNSKYKDYNIQFIVEDGSLTISKRHITMTSASDSKVFDGQPLSNNNVTLTQGSFANGEGVTYTVTGSQTQIGSSQNWFTFTPTSKTNMDNYVVNEVEGTLTVTAQGANLDLTFYDEYNNYVYHPTTQKVEEGKTVTLVLNGGSYSYTPSGWTKVGNNYQKKLTGNLTYTENPVLSGYVFTGWTYSKDNSGNVTLTAQWKLDKNNDSVPDEYQVTVSFAITNGTWNGTDSAKKTVVLTMSKNGDWATKANGGYATLASNQIPTGMQPNTGYKSGSWDNAPNTSKTIDQDTTFTYNCSKEDALKLTYYDNYDEDGYHPTSNDVEQGKTITLVLNGGNYPTVPAGWTKSGNNYTKTMTQNYTYTSNPVRSAYVFTGWSYSKDNNGNVTLTAQWKADNNNDNIPDEYQVTVTFSITNGTWNGTDASNKTVVLTMYKNGDWATKANGGYATLASNQIPTGMTPNTGYVTGSWDNEPKTSNTIDANTTYTYNCSKEGAMKLTYYGSYDEDGYHPATNDVEQGKTITLVLNGGNYPTAPAGWTKSGNNYTKTMTQNYTYTNNPIRSGYVFTGWSYSKDNAGNVTLTAQWKVDNNNDNIPDEYQVTVTFAITNGTWNGTDASNKTVVLTMYKNGDWATKANGGYATLASNQIPTGMTPNNGYKSGAWNTQPNTTTSLNTDTTYTYVCGNNGYYNVTVEKPNNGSLTSDKTVAQENEIVTLNVSPDTAYKLVSLSVKDKNGNIVTLTKVNDSKYTFKMPASEVTVTASFKLDSGVDRYLQTGNHIVYITGYKDGSIKPDNNITRAETAMMFYRLLLNQNVKITTSFSDVKADAWYGKAVLTLASMGIITGYNGGTFQPNRNITRAEFTVMAMRFAYVVNGNKSFIDVPTGYWAEPQISAAATYGWINGYKDGTFNPNGDITRCEVASIINNMLEREADKNYVLNNKSKLTQFTDLNNTGKWYYYEMVEASTAHNYYIDLTTGEERWYK